MALVIGERAAGTDRAAGGDSLEIHRHPRYADVVAAEDLHRERLPERGADGTRLPGTGEHHEARRLADHAEWRRRRESIESARRDRDRADLALRLREPAVVDRDKRRVV